MATMKQANAALRKLPPQAKREAQGAMNTTAERVAAGATARAPERTGLLKGSIRWESRPSAVMAVVGVDTRAFYWKFLEYGTVKMSARPMFRPAAEAERDAHLERLQEALEHAADVIALEAR